MTSANFARIKGDVIAIATAIPEGRLMTFKGISDYLDVMPRHVAYILATLPDVLAEAVPWYRVIPETGALVGAKHQRRRQLLIADGFILSDRGILINLQQLIFGPQDVPSAFPLQSRALTAGVYVSSSHPKN